MNEIERRIRGKIRQNRSERFNVISDAVNATSQIIAENFEPRQKFILRTQTELFRVLIMSTENDFPLAYINSQHLLEIYPSQIMSIDIVTPSDLGVQQIDKRIRVRNENYLLTNLQVTQAIKKFRNRSNWIKQQYLKMKYVENSDAPVLVIDADTFLTRPIFLYGDGNHTLLIGTQDYHYPYTSHARSFYGRTQPLLNFVNHLQIQIPEVYKEIFSGDFDKRWIHWVSLGRVYGEDSAVSEFQTYAGQILNQSKYLSILATLRHATIDVGDMSLTNFVNYLASFDGDLLTAGNKLKLKP